MSKTGYAQGRQRFRVEVHLYCCDFPYAYKTGPRTSYQIEEHALRIRREGYHGWHDGIFVAFSADEVFKVICVPLNDEDSGGE